MDKADLTNKELELQEARERVDQLASAITHDLQGSLRHISAFAEILKEELSDQVTEDQREMLGILSSKADELRELVRLVFVFMRDTSRIERRRVEADAALAAACETLAEDIAARQATVSREPLPAVVADPILLSKIFENVVRNALQHTARQPVIRIYAGKHDNGMADILIEDNGNGIEERYQANIFKPFWSLKADASRGSGAGLGLTFCQKALDGLGGSIDLLRSDPSGSTFRIRLPLA
jgi:signal transduction histidine kinase